MGQDIRIWAKSRETDRVKWSSIDSFIHLVRTGNTMRSEERNDLERREVASILEAGEDLVHVILGLGNETVDRCNGFVGATSHELELRRARAVAKSDSTSELDKITSADGRMPSKEGDQVVDAVVNAVVRREVGFHSREQQHGAVSTSTPTVLSGSA
jgi:hypothetical protein